MHSYKFFWFQENIEGEAKIKIILILWALVRTHTCWLYVHALQINKNPRYFYFIVNANNRMSKIKWTSQSVV